MKSENLFWGVILITLGILIGLRNFDIFYFTWGSLFQLWPLILVFLGISALPMKSGVKIILTFVAIFIGILLLVSNPRSGGWRWNWFDHVKIEKETEKQPWIEQDFQEDLPEGLTNAVLKLDAAAGLFILDGITDRLYEFETEGNIGPFEATLRKTGDQTAIIQLFGETNIKFKGNIKNTVRIRLNENPVWVLDMNAGASKVEMDLTPFIFSKINIDGGASAIDLKIGERSGRTDIRIKAGASALKIRIPESSACEVSTKTVLSGKDIVGFNQIERGLYQTPNFSDTSNQVHISIDAAVSGVNIERY
ncbi:MAG: LiaI-LiaF-like domain-containing protein [Bacteroidales bacterium]